MSSPMMNRMLGFWSWRTSSTRRLSARPSACRCWRRAGPRPSLRLQAPALDAALDQRRLDRIGAGTRQGLVLRRLTGRIGVPDDLQAPVRELLHHRRDVVEQRLRLLLDRRLAGLEMDAVEVEAALDVERLRHRLAAVLLLELLGRLRRVGRKGRQRRPSGRPPAEAAGERQRSHRFIGRSFRSRYSSFSISLQHRRRLSQQLGRQLPILLDPVRMGGSADGTAPPPPGSRDSPRRWSESPDCAKKAGGSGRTRPAGRERALR